MKCLFFHRWTRWVIEFDECPPGWNFGVYEFRSRTCTACGMAEEESRCVS